jgi:hydroxymethylbilane synthase
VHAEVEGDRLTIDAFVGLPDGSEWLRDRLEASAEEPSLAGAELAQRLLAAGARDVLDRAEEM